MAMDGATGLGVLTMLVAVAVPGLLLFIGLRRTRAEGGTLTAGFKGWLFVLAVAMWFAPFRILAEIGKAMAPNDGAAVAFPLLFQLDRAVLGLSLLVTVTCLVLMIRRSAAFPRAFTAYAAWMVVSPPLTLALAGLLLDSVYDTPVSVDQLLGDASRDIIRWIVATVFLICWTFYIRRSRRVALTFTR